MFGEHRWMQMYDGVYLAKRLTTLIPKDQSHDQEKST